jgi:type VI secretion system protein ImpJ
MKHLSRVVWSEGMYLGPHQFQAQNRYFEDSLQFATSTLRFQPYGLTGVALDADALRNGTVSVLHARGLFSDGLAFHIPECDSAPPPRAIGEAFPPTREAVTILLAIPARDPRKANVSLSNGLDARFVAETRPIEDETTGGDERQVRLARKNVRLLLDSEPREGFETLPLARVVRDGAGHFTYDPRYVPPCVQISASERLMLLVRQLIEILGEKSARLALGSAKPGDYSPREIANFWLLHAVNTGLAALRHLWTAKRGHPEELFLELSRLAGALCTFGLQSHPNDLPTYDHERLGECFDALEQHIRTHLEIVVPTNCVTIPLEPVADYFWEGEVSDTRCLGRARWILGVQSSVGEAELITRTPQLVKICSSKFIGELVKRAMAGLTLTHLPAPPPAVPLRVEAQYFGIAKAGPFWDHIVQTRRVGIYVPGELPSPQLELLVVLDS